jgi:hypothetical protein
VSYEEALEQALSLANDEEALDAFLTGVPEWAPRLRAALRVTTALQSQTHAMLPDAVTTARVETRVLDALSARRQAAGGGWLSGLFAIWASLPSPRPIVAAGSIGLVLAIVTLIALPLLQSDPQGAQAVVIKGSVAEVGPSVVTVNQDGYPSTIKLSDTASFTDGVGNAVDVSALSPGQSVVLKGTRVGNEVVAESLEIESRIFGVVSEIRSDLIVISTSQGIYEIVLTAQTQMEGNVVTGAYVEVEVTENGGFVALEIEVEDEHEDGEDDGGDEDGEDGASSPTHSPGSSGVPASTGSPPTSTSGSTPAPSAGYDDGGEDEDDDEHQTAQPTEAPKPQTPAPTEGPEATERPEPTEGPEATEVPEIHDEEDEPDQEDSKDQEDQEEEDQQAPEAEEDGH